MKKLKFQVLFSLSSFNRLFLAIKSTLGDISNDKAF